MKKRIYIFEVEGKPSVIYPWYWRNKRKAAQALEEALERHPGIAYRLATYVRQEPKPR